MSEIPASIRNRNKRLLLAFVLAVVIVVVTVTVLANTLMAQAQIQYRRVEFSAPPMSIPGTSFGWDVCTQNANTTVTCISENDQHFASQLPPIVIGNGEDVNQTQTTAPAKLPQQTAPTAQPPIVVFGG